LGENQKKRRNGALLNGSFHVETLLEAVNASAGINQLLLAGKERVALGANFNLQLGLDRPRLKRLTAYATDDGLAIFGMDLFFHAFSPLLRMLWVVLNRKNDYSIVMCVLQEFFPKRRPLSPNSHEVFMRRLPVFERRPLFFGGKAW
jgi:hypothetical protein